MVHGILSDLFFNHEHPAYEKLMGGNDKEICPSEGEIYAAVAEDVKEFLVCYGAIIACEVPCGNDLTRDFMARL